MVLTSMMSSTGIAVTDYVKLLASGVLSGIVTIHVIQT